MILDLVVTDITYMTSSRICVACVNNQGESIRPKYRHRSIQPDWCFLDRQVIQPFSRIQLDLEEQDLNPPHTEDWYVRDSFLNVRGIIQPEHRKTFLRRILDNDVESIFGAEINHAETGGYYIRSGEGYRSLGTIHIHNTQAFKHCFYDHDDHGQWDYRFTFQDDSGKFYRLKIVDLTFQCFVNYLRIHDQCSCQQIEDRVNQFLKNSETYLRIGLARGWADHPETCYLQITGVYTFPDYLEGKNFNHFQVDNNY